MQSYMTIKVNVIAAQALAKMQALRAQQQGLARDVAVTNRTPGPVGARHLRPLLKFGNQLQWTGRMLQYNFTLPLALAGAVATKWSLEQEKAFKHVEKVYGDTTAAAQQFRREMKLGREEAMKLAESYQTEELEALDKAFTALSNHYGVQKKEVLEVAGAWAAAGQSGVDLAKSVDATMKAMIIGDLESAEATEALIAIQAQYNLSSKELMATLANLNSVENQTGAQMDDLVIGFSKAAGVARSAGVETQQLAAYMAALVPATGKASTAGNALKTIFSRLLAPTRESSQVIDEMGLDIESMAWQSATATERLELMAEAFDGLDTAQKNAASSVIASRWQINRFDVLMREIVSTTGYYAKALESAKDQGESFTRMQNELNTILESNPRQMERTFAMLQNAMVDVIQPMIPYILWLADAIADAVKAFSNIDPYLQKFILSSLAISAIVFVLIRYIGAFITLWGILSFVVVGAVHALFRAVGAFGVLLAPIKMLGTVMMGTLGLLSSSMVWFFSTLVGTSAAGMAKLYGITVGGLAAKMKAWRIWYGLQLVSLKNFWGRFLTLWTTATVLAGSRWAAFLLLTLTMTQRGLVALAARFVAATAVVKAVVVMGAGVVAAWRLAMATLIIATVGSSKILIRVWLATAASGIGIWSKLKTSIVVIHTAMSATVVAISKAMWTTLVAVYSTGGKRLLQIVRAMALRIIPFLLGPWGIAIAAIAGLLYAFRNQISQIWNNIIEVFAGSGGSVTDIFRAIADGIMGAFKSLPQGVQNVMVAIVTIIRDAALAVYDWFSYINPWATHSPSLVDNVTTGMRAVNKQFATLGNIKKYTSSAYAEIAKFGKLTAKLGVSASAVQAQEDRSTLKKAGAGKALGSYNKLIAMLNKLSPVLARLEKQMTAQERVVDSWQNKVDKANKVLDSYKDSLDAAEESLNFFANVPLEGMRAMEEQIFRNQMRQTELRHEMMKFEEVHGTFDELKSKIEAINGAQEVLRGTQSDLRAAGAGSEILSQYDAEISKLDDQRDKYAEAANTLSTMQAKLDKLQRQAEKLDLVKAMKFDELQHQIDMAANSMEEMPFDEIMQGIQKANAEIDKYAPLVDKATEARDKMQAGLDREEAKLDRIKQRYDAVNDAMQAIKSSISDVTSNAQKMNDALAGGKSKKKGSAAGDYMSPGLENFLRGKGANYPDVGGVGIPPREDWTSQADEIDKFTEQLSMDTASMFEQINPFTPLKSKAVAAWNWIKDKSKLAAVEIGDFFTSAFSGVSFGGGGGVFDSLESIGEFVTEVLRDIGKVIKSAWDLLGPDIIKIGQGIWDGLKSIWEQIGPELVKFGDLWEPIGKSIQNVWAVVKPVLAVLIGAILGGVKIITSVLAETLGPLLSDIGGVLAGLIRIIRGVFEVIFGILSGDWSLAWDGVVSIVSGAFKAIWSLIKGAGNLIWNIIKGIVKGIYGFFKWLYDELVGHSIIPDMIDGIIWWFEKLVVIGKWLWNNVIQPVLKLWLQGFKFMIAGLKIWWRGITLAFSVLTTLSVWFWNNILSPLVNLVVGLWNNFLGPAFSFWWTGVKIAFAALMFLGKWFWNNVLEPVWNAVQRVWKKFIWPGIKLWWAGFKKGWGALAKAGKWWWKNVLEPIWNVIEALWKKYIWPAIKAWWVGFKKGWSALTTAGKWFWNNVLEPVWNRVQDVWKKNVGPEIAKWRERFIRGWNGLKTLGSWVKREVMDPIWDKVTGGWNRIKNWLNNNKDMLKEPVEGIVNTVIRGINKLIKGLNKISDILPGDINWNISPIQEFAQGGVPSRRGNRGFKTSGARAIVGEGKANYPEFVIPTDPTYRKRAMGLLGMAASKIGAGVSRKGIAGDTPEDVRKLAKQNPRGFEQNVPQFGIGGWLSGAWDNVKDVAGWFKKKGRQAIAKTMDPAFKFARNKANGIEWKIPKKPALYGINKVQDWVAGVEEEFKKQFDKNKSVGIGSKEAKAALGFARRQAGKPYLWGGAGPGGYDCSGFMSAITNYIRGKSPYSRLGSTATFPWGGFATSGKMNPNGFVIGSSPSYAGGIGHMAGTLAGVNVESAGGVGVRIGSSARGWNDPGFSERGQLKGLKYGGIALKRAGGYPVRVAEGSHDEAIVPLPNDWRSRKGGEEKNYHFYGDLSFPNITDPEDAQTFLDNLDSLAKD